MLATVALVAGVPLLLTSAVGWPLPRSLPTLDALVQSARSGISDQVVVNTLAVIAWLAWTQLALALFAETISVARGRQAPRLPVLPGFQHMATRLIAGILMMTSTLQPARAAAPPIPLVTATAPFTETANTGPDDDAQISLTILPGSGTAPAETEHPTLTVQRHDSYWEIAERTLGEGLRWREILDLNVGRTMPDGTTIIAGDETLHTGWVLRLPADATVLGETEVSPDELDPAVGDDLTGAPDTIAVERGDNLWTISEDRLEDDLGREAAEPEVVPYWQEVIDANEDRYVEPGNPNLILPGQILVLPPTGLEEPAALPTDLEPAPPLDETPEPVQPPAPPPDGDGDPAPETPATTSGASVPTSANDTSPVTGRDSSLPDSDIGDDASSGTVAAIALGGLSSVALAVGLKRLIDRRRRRFANTHPGELPGCTPADQQQLHQAVVAQADEEQIDDLQGVLGWLAMHLAREASARRPRMIRHSNTGLELLLDQPETNAPTGWNSTDDGTVWTLVEPPDLDEPYDGPMCPAPLLVTIGQPEDDAQLYLDLETDGLLALVGDAEVATNLARSIVAELTLTPLADTLRVFAIGDVVDPEAKVLEHLTIRESWEDVAEDLGAWARQSHEALAENEWANAFVGRGHEPDHDALVPIAVVADQPPPAELASALRDALPSAVAVVVVGAFEGAAATVRCEPDTLNFDLIDLACSPQELAADELADMCRLLVATDSAEEQQLIDELRIDYEAAASSNGSAPAVAGPPDEPDREVLDEADPEEPPAYDVLVRLLGDITVEGGKSLKPKATSVVAYLALHRSVSTERLEEACWFGSDGTSHRKRLRDTMTECRDALGSQHFPANRSGAYVAGSGVRTDVELFEWHVHRAADLDPAEAVGHYQTALDLVTGKPFSYSNAARASFGWVDYEHHSTTWEYRVATIAQACAELYLDLGEPAEAIDMLRRVVQAIPLDNALVEALMRAHIADDDCAGAERVYKEHATALEAADLGDPEESIEQLRLDLQAR